MPAKNRNPQSARVLSITGVVLLLTGPALGAAGAPWWVVLLVVTVILGAGYVIAGHLQGLSDRQQDLG